MSITYNLNGSITISDIIKGQYIKQTYFDYTLKECKAMFKAYRKEYVKQFIVNEDK